jgi:hypothetical protein
VRIEKACIRASDVTDGCPSANPLADQPQRPRWDVDNGGLTLRRLPHWAVIQARQSAHSQTSRRSSARSPAALTMARGVETSNCDLMWRKNGREDASYDSHVREEADHRRTLLSTFFTLSACSRREFMPR